MTGLVQNLKQVAQDLDELGVAWAVVGGLAVAVHAEPRFTRDIDVAVATDSDGDADEVVFQLQSKRYSIQTVLEHTTKGRLSTIRLVPPAAQHGLLVDLLFASSGIEDLIARMARPYELVPGLTLPVARAGHLAAMKALAYDPETRPQDLADLRAILASADDDDVALAFDAAAEITKRGFNRDKDIDAILRSAVKAYGSAS